MYTTGKTYMYKYDTTLPKRMISSFTIFYIYLFIPKRLHVSIAYIINEIKELGRVIFIRQRDIKRDIYSKEDYRQRGIKRDVLI